MIFRPDTSFPFLAIAVKWRVPYADVIQHAEAWWQHFEGPDKDVPGKRGRPVGLDNDVIDAVVKERRRRATIAHNAKHTGDAP
jgi:hypothetical protein